MTSNINSDGVSYLTWYKWLLAWRRAAEVELIEKSGLFDEVWYRERNPVRGSGMAAAIEHYVMESGISAVRPHPLFAEQYYRSQINGKIFASLSALGHYIRCGAEKDIAPHPLFDPEWYRHRASLDLPGSGLLRHYLTEGARSGISPHPAFDPAFYLQQDPGLASVNRLTHFVECGFKQGLRPNRIFDTSWYLQQYSQLQDSQTNPLAHFMENLENPQVRPAPGVNLHDIANRMGQGVSARTAFERLIWSNSDYLTYIVNAGDQNGSPGSPLIDIFGSDNNVLRPYRGIEASYEESRNSEISVLSDALSKDRPIASGLEMEDPFLPDEIDKFEYLSFDVWDTLLRRQCHPDEIKFHLARALCFLAWPHLRPAYRNIKTLYRVRRRCEDLSAPNDEFEYRFTDAMELWLRTVLNAGTDANYIEDLGNRLLDIEFDAELRATWVDEKARLHLPLLRKPLVYASDFYHSSRFMDRLLQRHGIREYFIKSYVSSDSYTTKRSGRMYDHLVTDLAVESTYILHIGDNVQVDGDKAKERGLASHVYRSTSAERRRDMLGSTFQKYLEGEPVPQLVRLADTIEQLAQSAEARGASPLSALGIRLSPLALAYSLGIVEDALRESVEVVHFLTREGYFFRKFFDAVVAANPYGLGGPRSELLEVSRRSTFAASLSDVSLAAFGRIWSLYSKQSMKALSVTLNIASAQVRPFAERHGLEWDEPIDQPAQDTRIQSLFDDVEFRDLIQSVIDSQRELLLGYLAQSGLSNEQTQIICDIGWRGTIQDNIAHLLRGTSFRGHYLGLFEFLNPQPSNGVKFGHVFDINIGRGLSPDEVAPFEMMFNGPGGSVTGYKRTQAGIEAVKAIIPDEEDVICNEVAEIQAGMLSVVPQLCEFVRLHGLTSEDVAKLAMLRMREILESPPAALADAFFRMAHNETFGVGESQNLAECRKLCAAVAENTGRRLHREVAQLSTGIRWPSGWAARSGVRDVATSAAFAQTQALPTNIYKIVHGPAYINAQGTRVLLYAPPPLRGSGGHRTMFNMVRGLHRHGFRPQILVEGTGDGLAVVEDYLGGISAPIHVGWNQPISADVAFATIAHSAQVVASSGVRHGYYLVQDWEALFNPMSDGYVIAENSYSFGLNHFTIGNWLSHRIPIEFGGKAWPAGLGVDTAIYRPRQDVVREKAVCFLYQPDKPRRTPRLGIDALRMVKRAMPEVKIFVYGSDLPIQVDFAVENLGLILDLNELAALYARCQVGLCISGSNPSRIPYEMMATGCVPVDLYRYNNLLDHDADSAVLAFQDAPSIAKAILDLLTQPERLNAMSVSAAESAASRTLDWEVDVLTNNLIASISGSLPAPESLDPVYSAQPIIAAESARSEVEWFCRRQLELADRKVICDDSNML